MESHRTKSVQNQVFFYLLFAALAALVLWLISGYLGIIAFALVMVIILKPVHRFFFRHLGKRDWLATALTLLLFSAAVIIPAWLMLSVIVNQITTLADTLNAGEDIALLEQARAQINEFLDAIPGAAQVEVGEAQVEQLRTIGRTAVSALAQAVVGLGMTLPALLASLFIFLGIVGALLPNYHEFAAFLVRISPLDDEVDRIYLRKLRAMVWSMFVGIFIIALIQGLSMGVIYLIGGIALVAVWTLLSTVAAMLPLGASIIAIPIGVVELLAGRYTSGVIVLAGYLLIVSNIDNLIRPKLVSKEAYLNFALLLLGALGGYQLFGFFGVVYGPVLMILLVTTIQVYDQYYRPQAQAAVAAVLPSSPRSDANEDSGEDKQEVEQEKQS